MVNHEVDTWIRNTTFAAAPTPASEDPLEVESMGGAIGGKKQPRGVTVEETEDKDRSCPQSVTNTSGSQGNRFAAPVDGWNPGELDKSQLGTPVLRPPPFPMPEDYPRVNEKTPNASSPSIYLQRHCPLCFSGSKPNLSHSACVSGLASSDKHVNPHLHQFSGHSLR